MSFVRNLVSDLIEKKLWPLAVVLLVALVAVPVMLGGGGDNAASTAPVAQAPTATAATNPAAGTKVSLDETAAGRRNRAGKVRNPFAQQHAPSSAAATATATTITKSTGGASSGTAGTGTTTTPAATTPPPSGGGTPSIPKPDPLDSYRVTLRFGKAGKQKTLRDIARFSPLPSGDSPFFIYLGVLDDLETAVFMISSDATATGDGTCRPRKTDCQTIEMKAGDTEFFDFGTGEDVVQYQMDLKKVAKHTASSNAVAARAHKRQSKKGRATLQLAKSAGVGAGSYRYEYDRKLGVLHRVSRKAAAKSAKAHPKPKAIKGVDPLTALRMILGATAAGGRPK
jgi:hypothetical protein